MVKNLIRIGTRGSILAIYQAEQVKKLLNNFFPELSVQIKIIQTKGDKVLDIALSKIGDKGLFTKEIENALLENQIDIAVHSLKDLATEIPFGLKIGAILERGDYRDALLHREGKKIKELSEKDVIATSSLRRKAGIAMLNKAIKTIDIRGNVNTRIKRMEDGYCDGLIMAAAGLIRLGLEHYIKEFIEPDLIIPAVGQGAIVVECRDNNDLSPFLEVLNHETTRIAITAERSFLKAVEGGCQIPVGSLCTINGNKLTIKGFIASIDGKENIIDTLDGTIDNPEMVGEKLADNLLKNGGRKILDEIRNIS